jgi:hypothetical protein
MATRPLLSPLPAMVPIFSFSFAAFFTLFSGRKDRILEFFYCSSIFFTILNTSTTLSSEDKFVHNFI